MKDRDGREGEKRQFGTDFRHYFSDTYFIRASLLSRETAHIRTTKQLPTTNCMHTYTLDLQVLQATTSAPPEGSHGVTLRLTWLTGFGSKLR